MVQAIFTLHLGKGVLIQLKHTVTTLHTGYINLCNQEQHSKAGKGEVCSAGVSMYRTTFQKLS